MDDRRRVAVLGLRAPSLDVEQEELREFPVDWAVAAGTTAEEIVAHAGSAEVVLCGSAPRFTPEVIENLTRCRAIIRYGIGVDNVDLDAATRKGIWVVNVPDYCIDEVASFALTLLLACWRRLVPAVDQVRRDGSWSMQELRPIEDLSQQTLALIGFGRIGQSLARKAVALGLEVVAYDPYADEGVAGQLGVKLLPLQEAFRRADYLSLHAPLTPETRHLVNRETLALMKPTAYVINTARGGLIDEEALREALDAGRLAGAALDVLAQEPPEAGHPLIGHPKVLVTPHMAWYTERSAREMRVKAAREAARVLRGERPVNVVNGVSR